MAKKHPPGWKKKQEEKKAQKAQSNLDALLNRMEKNPENFIAWGYSDSEGNDMDFWLPSPKN